MDLKIVGFFEDGPADGGVPEPLRIIKSGLFLVYAYAFVEAVCPGAGEPVDILDPLVVYLELGDIQDLVEVELPLVIQFLGEEVLIFGGNYDLLSLDWAE